MDDGANGLDSSPKSKNEPVRPGGGPGEHAGGTEAGSGALAPGDQQSHSAVGDPVNKSIAERCLEESNSPQAAAAARVQERTWLQKAREVLIPLLVTGFQLTAAKAKYYGEAVVDRQKKAEDQYDNVQDGTTKAYLVKNQMLVDEAIGNHKDYCPLLANTDVRRDLMGYALGDGKDPHCIEITNVIQDKYWTEVLSNGGKLLDPNSTNPDERNRWQAQVKILSYVASLLVKDDNCLLHPEQIDRYNDYIDPATGKQPFRPLDEPLPPPADFSHHLPEKFVTDIFLKDGKPREFNVRDIMKREMLSIFHGQLKSDLDAEERAVLALHREVLDQVRPWWLLADGDLVKDAGARANRDALRDNILQNYKADFQKFDLQIAVVQEKNANTWLQEWNKYKKLAIGEIPSTAQMMHFVTQAEAATLTPEQKKERCWDTRNQTDAELIRETIRLAEWRYLKAVQSFVNDGVLFPQAIGTKPDAQLPSAMLVQVGALGAGRNEFRNPSIVEDPARRFATRQLIWDFNRGRKGADAMVAYPSIFGNAITANGRAIKIASDDEIDKGVRDNLTRWNDHGYPWPLAYVYNHNTNDKVNRSRRDALEAFRPLDEKNNKARADFMDLRDPNKNLKTFAEIQANTKKQIANQAAMQLSRRRGVCECTHELTQQNVNPSRLYVPNPKTDPLLETIQAIVILTPP